MKVELDAPVVFSPAGGPPPVMPFCYKPFSHSELDNVSKEFYVSAMNALNAAGCPFLVGGAYAFAHYSDIERHTKDFDIFVRREDADKILAVLERDLNCKVDRTFPHWLFKAILGVNFIDIIFSSGNGMAIVDDVWFEKAPRGVVLGVDSLLVPAEEMIWSKGFIMERERFDGADVAHIIKGWGRKMDWERLLARIDTHWRVLLSHLVLFGYIYPGEKDAIPSWVISRLSQQMLTEHNCLPLPPSLPPATTPLEPPTDPSSSSSSSSSPPSSSTSDAPRLCQGTLLSRLQYLKDVAEWQYRDSRTHSYDGKAPFMSDADVAHWTAAAFNGIL
eukprot:Phypoly_transcript_10604.p1 GENE.Phypoly_transcript_10604~~Phypoly_transcript_10604.p1  ORF type:complete len:332 (+),score=64.46 Phypoly_transcript_10604:166-1161(+)